MHFLSLFPRERKRGRLVMHINRPLLLFIFLIDLFCSLFNRDSFFAPLFYCYTDMTITEMRVHMDCRGCEKQIRKALENLEGVDDVIIDLSMQKVTVMGWAEQKKVLKAVRRNGRTAELWPYPYNPQYHGFIHHYQYLNSPQHQPQTKPVVTYNSLPSSSSRKHKLTQEYDSSHHDASSSGLAADYGYYYETPPFSTIDEDVGAMFSDENPHSCSIM
ncbi:heavy metal-associated isoprenylated plant protein 28-like [Momordica charantia]|uniref:Heavy metal-associated isoprenylated plant protein 28-like n=1 Tax=Momordica charantia TaxID=3673 RepID=A0A6J1CFI8_MOMCH|nr:heavy metal-associated isoprenylated plant protein 28-like [Momordica charantia]